MLQLALLNSIETQEETAKAVMIAVTDAQQEETATANFATLQITLKTMVQDTVYAILDTIKMVRFAHLVMTRAKSVWDQQPTAQPATVL